MKKLITIFSFSLLLLVFSCTDNTIYTNVENPIILVSGYGSKVALWEESGFVKFMEQKGLVYGGKIILDKENPGYSCAEKQLDGNIDFFSLAYSDSTTKVNDLSDELDQAIEYVLEYTNVEQVMLVGYSMGGLVCRNYLVQNQDNYRVATLTTICSPHNGSFLANIALSSTSILGEAAKKMYIDYFADNFGIDVDGEALNDLMKDEDNNFLKQLNTSPHPEDINYISIIGINELAVDINPYLSKLNFTIYDGDLVCSKESQNMNNVEWFKENSDIQSIILEIKGVHHLNVLEEHDKIFSVLNDFIIYIPEDY